jgi:hypothetical protein
MLNNSAMLVSLSLSAIASSRADKDTTQFVLRAQQAGEDAGRWTARLWPKEALDPIRSLDTRIRAYFHQKTLPWLDAGQRIIASKIYLTFIDEMRALRHEREAAVATFLGEYERWIDKARVMRGNAFDGGQYPPFAKARQRFSMELEISPLPSAADFRIQIREEELESLRSQLTDRIEAAENNARRDLFARIAAPVTELLNKLSDPDATLRDSTLNSIRTIAATIPEINLWEDPAIEALRKSLESIAATPVAVLKESRSYRARTASKASSILATMAPWMELESESADDEAAENAA